MKISKVYVSDKEGFSSKLKRSIDNLGIKGIESVREFSVFWLAQASIKDLNVLSAKLLHSSFTQEVFINTIPKSLTKGALKVEVVSDLGVIDPREASFKKAARDLGVKKEIKVRFGRLYSITGRLNANDLALIKRRLLIKNAIEHEVTKSERIFVKTPKYKFKLTTVPISKANEQELLKISESGRLSLNISEMKEIQNYFKGLGRGPTDIELETIAQTWSEHCSHKTLKGNFLHNGTLINNLLKTAIIEPSLALRKPYVVSAFEDNAGGVKIGNRVICVKVETHNHPSALEPVGGAETGTGGVIRDIIGFGKGAKPVSSIVCFCVGPQDLSYDKLPQGVLHPKAILSGIVEGTKSYGNQMGIPTDFFQDSLLVHKNYVGNPLVYCGAVGETDLDSAKKLEPRKGDLVVLLGGFTGRDGVHGANFSSESLKGKSETTSLGAVQIGDAIMEKKTQDAILEIKDKRLSPWITDCGGGGLSSAIGETGKNIGVLVNLDKVPKKYEGLSYSEIWISESQERMIVVCSEDNKGEILEICRKFDVPATVIGEFTGKSSLELYYGRKKVADIGMKFLHDGCPVVSGRTFWKEKKRNRKKASAVNFGEAIKKLLSDPDLTSKALIAHQYDSTVQGGTIIGPFTDEEELTHEDVTIRKLSEGQNLGFALTITANPNLTSTNPRYMSHWIITHSLAKLAVSGADFTKSALLDNFSWGSPKEVKVMGELVESLLGCKDAVEGFKVPFISGKDSLNNQFKGDKGEVTIPGTLLITALAPMLNIKKVVDQGFQNKDDAVLLLGELQKDMGGSCFGRLYNLQGEIPKINFEKTRALLVQLSFAIRKGLIESGVAIGKGGLALALAKACVSSGLAAEINLDSLNKKFDLKNHEILFSESAGAVVVTVKRKLLPLVKEMFLNDYLEIGIVAENRLKIRNSSKTILDETVESLSKVYKEVFSNYYEA
ncbi:MAG: phosphoribosylformylglycinamidine synthase subunit PurL [Candidatus Woykebacteria bacterium]